MTSDVVLSAALRSNLLSLQNTQKSIDTTQGRLSTGKKVNSALDNPQSFFAAQSLTNRAADLTKLLDSLSQSIQVIKSADNGVTALTTLINQAQSLANTAQSTLAGASTTAKTVGTVTLDGTKTWNTITGLATNNVITINVTDPTGGTNKLTNQAYTVTATDTINDVITKINDFNTTNGLSTPAINASLDSSGKLVFEAVNGGTLSVQFADLAAQTDAGSLAMAAALGYAGIVVANTTGAATTNNITGFTAKAGSTITSNALYSAAGTLASGTTLLSALKDSSASALTNITAAGDTFKLKVGGKTSADLLNWTPSGGVALTALTSTVASVVDAINKDTTINTLVSASFDATTGKITLSPLTAAATDIQFQFGGAAAQSFSLATAAYANGIGFGNRTLTTAAQLFAFEDVRFGAAAGTLASLQTQYNTTLTQIDSLVKDTGYAGTNLLNGNNLVTYFNETRTSSLTSAGVTFNSAGLGLSTASFQSASAISTAITQTNTALTSARNFGSTLATNLAIIQSRQDFTEGLIDTLNTGASALTTADQNEEGAKLLALQTRQSLGVTALSLASQSNQSILRLFG